MAQHGNKESYSTYAYRAHAFAMRAQLRETHSSELRAEFKQLADLYERLAAQSEQRTPLDSEARDDDHDAEAREAQYHNDPSSA